MRTVIAVYENKKTGKRTSEVRRSDDTKARAGWKLIEVREQ